MMFMFGLISRDWIVDETKHILYKKQEEDSITSSNTLMV